MDTVLNGLIFLSSIWIIYRVFTKTLPFDDIAGKVCIFSSIIVFSCPLKLIFKVIKAKNYLLIPVVMVIFSILSGVSWVLYGVMKKDFYIAGVNLLQIIIGSAEVIIRNNLKKKYSLTEEGSKISPIGIENDNNDTAKKLEDGNKIKTKEFNIEKN